VDTQRFQPEQVRLDPRGLNLLCDLTDRSAEGIAGAPIITEISRTARTKRKDVLIRAFAEVRKSFPAALLAVSIDANQQELHDELTGLIAELALHDSVAVLGSVWDQVPSLYGLSALYCTPAIMEGFGMSIQEAAACKVACVACSRVPFATEYLLGENPREEKLENGGPIQLGAGAIVVPPDDVPATATAIERLLTDDTLRERMAENAYHITVPAFSWREATKHFLAELGVKIPGGES
jgi:glycosyltransferase involved in cell wall biosynthesis